MAAVTLSDLVFVRLPAESGNIARHVSIQVGMFIPCLLFAKWGWPQHKDHWTLADLFLSLLVFPTMTVLSIMHCAQTYQTVHVRWNVITDAGDLFQLIFVARTIMHVPVQCLQQMKKEQFIMMTTHHIISIMALSSGYLSNRMQFYGCFAGMCEASTVFLTIMGLFKEVKVKGKPLQEVLPKWMYVANGLCLWLCFLVFRIILFPTWLYMWYDDVITVPETWDRSNIVERYMYPGVTALLFCLSTFWFFPITKGCLKAFRGNKKSENGKAQ